MKFATVAIIILGFVNSASANCLDQKIDLEQYASKAQYRKYRQYMTKEITYQEYETFQYELNMAVRYGFGEKIRQRSYESNPDQTCVEYNRLGKSAVDQITR